MYCYGLTPALLPLAAKKGGKSPCGVPPDGLFLLPRSFLKGAPRKRRCRRKNQGGGNRHAPPWGYFRTIPTLEERSGERDIAGSGRKTAYGPPVFSARTGWQYVGGPHGAGLAPGLPGRGLGGLITINNLFKNQEKE